MSRVEEALAAIDTCAEAIELLGKRAADFVSGDCISMMAEWLRGELTAQSDIIRSELNISEEGE
jgi:hypothetical protein